MSFLRHYEGAIPGVKRKQIDTSTAKKDYEKKRKRSFQESWFKLFPWLRYDNVLNLMYCKNCEDKTISSTEDSSPFVKGTDKFKIDVLKTHANSKSNLKKAAIASAEAKPMGRSQAAECLSKLKKAEYDRLVLKFRTVHTLAKCHLSFNLYKTICRLDKVKGLDLGSSYLNDKAAANFMSSIAKVTKNDVSKTPNGSSYCSFTIDGATDFTGDDIENIYVRTCVQEKIIDTFLHIGSAESSCSQDIYNYVQTVFENYGLCSVLKEKLVDFTVDGASNMQGKKNGLASLLRKECPHLVVTHCLAHRLELAFKDGVKEFKLYEKTMTLILGLFYIYRKSPKSKKSLLRSFESLEMMPILVLGGRVG